MKKYLYVTVLMISTFACFAGKSWAFGSRHHDGNSNNSSGGGYSTGDNSVITGNGTGNTQNPPNPNTYNPDSKGQTNFPVAPVPEPMTLSLLGTGLAGLILRRNKRRS